MNKTRLLPYQLHEVKCRLNEDLYPPLEKWLLEKYQVFSLDELKCLDYDAIINDLEDWTWELASELL